MYYKLRRAESNLETFSRIFSLAIIESIYDKPVKLVCINEDEKPEMVKDSIYAYGYDVDVRVETR